MQPTTRTLTIGTLSLLSVLLVSCTPDTNQPEDDTANDTASSVVATVNGEEIARTAFEANVAQAEQMAALQGQNTEDPAFRQSIEQQVLDQMIAEVLLRQNAEHTAIVISDSDVEAEYQDIVTQVGGEEALASQLAEAGFTDEKLRQDIRAQLLVQTYIQTYMEDKETSVTDEEVSALYEQLTAQGGEAPALTEIEAQLRAQLTQQKEQQMIADLIADLRAGANVEILL